MGARGYVASGAGVGMPTAEQLVALAKTPIYTGKRVPVNTSVAVPAGFSYTNGWGIARVILSTMDATNQYLWSVANGSTEQHGQLVGTTGKHQGRVVVGGSSKDVSTAQHYVNKAGQSLVVGFSWRDDGYEFASSLSGDSQDAYGSRQDFNDMTITLPRSSGGTELRIGSRNSGSENFNGAFIEYLEIGNEYLNEAQLYARMAAAASNPIFLVGIGQSLAKGFFTNEEDATGACREAFMSSLVTELGYAPDIATINCALGATALLKAHNTGAGYWWDEDSQKPGPLAITMKNRLKRLGIRPTFFLHAGHEGDANFIDRSGYKTLADYQTNLRAFYAWLYKTYPGVRILIQGIGRRTDGYDGGATQGTQKIREFQKTIATDTPYCTFFVEMYDVALYDTIHHTSAGLSSKAGPRMAKRFARVLGKNITGDLGPYISGTARVGAALTVTITHDAGTDFTPTGPTNVQGFRYYDTNGNEVALSNVVRATASTITATLARAVAGTLYYMQDAGADITNLSNVVVDNATLPMPLRPYKGAVA